MIDLDKLGRKIYSSRDGITVYCNSEEETITVNKFDMCISESYSTYSLKEEKGIWLWVEDEYMNTQFGSRNGIRGFGVIGICDKQEAKKFLVEKLVEPWRVLHEFSFKVDAVKLEAALREEFLS